MTVQNRIVTGTRLLLLLAATGAVCLGQMPPIDSGEYAAKVLTLTGQVSVLKDSTPWALEVGDQIQVKQLILTGGMARPPSRFPTDRRLWCTRIRAWCFARTL